MVTPAGRAGRQRSCKALLEKVITYEERLEKLAKRRDARVVDALVQAARVTADTLLDDGRRWTPRWRGCTATSASAHAGRAGAA